VGDWRQAQKRPRLTVRGRVKRGAFALIKRIYAKACGEGMGVNRDWRRAMTRVDLDALKAIPAGSDRPSDEDGTASAELLGCMRPWPARRPTSGQGAFHPAELDTLVSLSLCCPRRFGSYRLQLDWLSDIDAATRLLYVRLALLVLAPRSSRGGERTVRALVAVDPISPQQDSRLAKRVLTRNSRSFVFAGDGAAQSGGARVERAVARLASGSQAAMDVRSRCRRRRRLCVLKPASQAATEAATPVAGIAIRMVARFGVRNRENAERRSNKFQEGCDSQG
jgi:hypothetical protein